MTDRSNAAETAAPVAPPSSGSWGDNPRAAFAVRALVFLAPLVLSVAATWSLSRRWAAPESVLGALGRFVVLAVVAMAVAAAADRVARRFLPLAALLRLSLVFPDEAPSRFAVAFRSNNTKKLEKRLADLETDGSTSSESEAAQIIVELTAALSKHDRLTRGHSERVRAYTALIAEEMGLSAEDSNKLQWAGLIHDVGKLKIPYEILTKPGKLTDREFEIIKTHPTEGMRLAAPLADFLGEWIHAVGQHHERFDGGGYPNGLVGNQITLGARIVAVADEYDVITAARSYKPARSAKAAREELARCAGSQFDPVVVRAFLNIGIGPVRRAMWPLSWALQLPFIGTAVTAPIAQTVAASVVTLATATGVAASGGALAPLFNDVPEALAFVETARSTTGDTVVTTAAPATTDPSRSAPAPTNSVGDAAASVTSVAPETTTTTSTTVVVETTAVVEETTTTSTSTSTTTIAPTTTVPATTTTAAPTTTTTSTPLAPLNDCERAQAGESDLSDADLSGCNIGSVTFSQANFDGANLQGATFTDTVMVESSFLEADLTNASFIGVEAEGVYLKRTTMVDAIIQDSDLTGAVLYDADLAGVEIINSTLDNTDLRKARLPSAQIKESSLRQADLTDVQLTSSILKYSDFAEVTADRLDVSQSELIEIDFRNSALQSARFKYTVVGQVNFSGANLRWSDFFGSSIVDGTFEVAKIDGARFEQAVLKDTDFFNATANSDPVNFESAEFIHVTLGTVNFPGAIFVEAAFTGTEGPQSRMNGADFNGAAIQGLSLVGATLNESSWQNVHLAGLDIKAASLLGADFENSDGVPISHRDALLNGATCPNGSQAEGDPPGCW